MNGKSKSLYDEGFFLVTNIFSFDGLYHIYCQLKGAAFNLVSSQREKTGKNVLGGNSTCLHVALTHFTNCIFQWKKSRLFKGKRIKPNKPYTVASQWDPFQNPAQKQTSEKEYEKNNNVIQCHESCYASCETCNQSLCALNNYYTQVKPSNELITVGNNFHLHFYEVKRSSELFLKMWLIEKIF